MQHFNKESHTHISTIVSWYNYKNRIKFHGKHSLTFLFSPLCDANLWTAPDSDQLSRLNEQLDLLHTDQSRRVDTEDSRVNRLKNVAPESTPSQTAGKTAGKPGKPGKHDGNPGWEKFPLSLKAPRMMLPPPASVLPSC